MSQSIVVFEGRRRKLFPSYGAGLSSFYLPTMDAAVTAAVGDSQADGAAGLLAVDAAGLCLAAAGKLQEEASGRLAVLARAARRVQPDSQRAPVLVLETESSVCLVSSAGAVTTALLRDKA